MSPALAQDGKGGAWSVTTDLLAFGAGLALAWRQGWKTGDLVWSLWLSSFVVGYAMILWILAGPFFCNLPAVWQDRALVAQGGTRSAAGIALLVIAGLFFLGFFTFHFGGFHFGHSVFLAVFFPVEPGGGFPGWATYAEVWSRYWVWLPLAFVAERTAFTRAAFTHPAPEPADAAVTPEASARRKARPLPASLVAPYKNVIRMHVLIFFFAGAHFLKLESFVVYAVVYAAYFLPWRLLWRKNQSATGAT